MSSLLKNNSINNHLKEKYNKILKNKLSEAYGDDPFIEPGIPNDELIVDPLRRPSILPPARPYVEMGPADPYAQQRGIDALRRIELQRWAKRLWYILRYGRFDDTDLGIVVDSPFNNESNEQEGPIFQPGQGFWYWYNGEWKYFTYDPSQRPSFVINPQPGMDHPPDGQLYWDHETKTWKRAGQDPLFDTGRQLYNYYTLWQLAQRFGFGNADALYVYLEIANNIAAVQGIEDAIHYIHSVYPNRGDIILQIFGIKDWSFPLPTPNDAIYTPGGGTIPLPPPWMGDQPRP